MRGTLWKAGETGVDVNDKLQDAKFQYFTFLLNFFSFGSYIESANKIMKHSKIIFVSEFSNQ
jgi:hypothetical protein